MPLSALKYNRLKKSQGSYLTMLNTCKSYIKTVICNIIILGLVISLPCTTLALPLPRVFVVPPSGDGQKQTEQIGKRLTSSLKEYLKKSKRLKLEDGKAKRRASKDGKLMEAESLKVSSIDLYKAGKFNEAQTGLVSSISGFQKSVASIRDMKSVYQALYYAAAASLALEYDDDAKDYFRQLAAIAPEGDFEVQVDAKVKKKYLRERKRLLKKKKGALSIETTPAGAKVWVNGIERCVSPCEVKDLPRGKHYIWVEKVGVGKAGSVKKVKAGWSSPVKYNLVAPKKSKSNELVPKELLDQLQAKLSEGKVDGQLKETLDQIAEDQEVGYTVFMYILTEKRNVKLFSFVYDFNEKRAVAIDPYYFKTNFSATRITAMKMVKKVEALVKVFPEDKNIDGLYPPLVDALAKAKGKKDVVVASTSNIATTPPVPPVTPVPPIIPPKANVKTKAEVAKVDTKSKTEVPKTNPLTPPKVKDFKAPPKEKAKSTILLPPPKAPLTKKDDDGGVLKSPWFWTGVSTLLVAGTVTGTYLLLDSSNEQKNYQSKVVWR